MQGMPIESELEALLDAIEPCKNRLNRYERGQLQEIRDLLENHQYVSTDELEILQDFAERVT